MVYGMTAARLYTRNPKSVMAVQFNGRADVSNVVEMVGNIFEVTMDGPTRLVLKSILGKRKFYVRETDWVIIDQWSLVNTLSNTAFERDFTFKA